MQQCVSFPVGHALSGRTCFTLAANVKPTLRMASIIYCMRSSQFINREEYGDNVAPHLAEHLRLFPVPPQPVVFQHRIEIGNPGDRRQQRAD